MFQNFLSVVLWKVHIHKEKIQRGHSRVVLQAVEQLDGVRTIADNTQRTRNAMLFKGHAHQFGVSRIVLGEKDFESFRAGRHCRDSNRQSWFLRGVNQLLYTTLSDKV